MTTAIILAENELLEILFLSFHQRTLEHAHPCLYNCNSTIVDSPYCVMLLIIKFIIMYNKNLSNKHIIITNQNEKL